MTENYNGLLWHREWNSDPFPPAGPTCADPFLPLWAHLISFTILFSILQPHWSPHMLCMYPTLTPQMRILFRAGTQELLMTWMVLWSIDFLMLLNLLNHFFPRNFYAELQHIKGMNVVLLWLTWEQEAQDPPVGAKASSGNIGFRGSWFARHWSSPMLAACLLYYCLWLLWTWTTVLLGMQNVLPF